MKPFVVLILTVCLSMTSKVSSAVEYSAVASSASSGVVFLVADSFSNQTTLVRWQPVRNAARIACRCGRCATKVAAGAVKAAAKTTAGAVKVVAGTAKVAAKVATAPVRCVRKDCR